MYVTDVSIVVFAVSTVHNIWINNYCALYGDKIASRDDCQSCGARCKFLNLIERHMRWHRSILLVSSMMNFIRLNEATVY